MNTIRSASWKSIAEFVGIVAIVLSLLMVAYELRQSTAVATSQAVFDVNTALDEAYRARSQDSELDELIGRGHEKPDTLSERERSQFYAWLRADMNISEATWFYQDRGIIPREDRDGYKAAVCSRVITPGGKQYWESEGQYFASGFRKSIDDWCY